MLSKRLDIVKGNLGWLIADDGPNRLFSTLDEAILVATREAEALRINGEEVEIHLWNQGNERIIV